MLRYLGSTPSLICARAWLVGRTRGLDRWSVGGICVVALYIDPSYRTRVVYMTPQRHALFMRRTDAARPPRLQRMKGRGEPVCAFCAEPLCAGWVQKALYRFSQRYCPCNLSRQCKQRGCLDQLPVVCLAWFHRVLEAELPVGVGLLNMRKVASRSVSQDSFVAMPCAYMVPSALQCTLGSAVPVSNNPSDSPVKPTVLTHHSRSWSHPLNPSFSFIFSCRSRTTS
ncbi:hypothetical protein FKP32DRAFT_1146989 [Trametes sanguinea]|nr:hypothetical protein FKP32DRAFT_1146989 [Trametes sanguinea]